MPPQNTQESWEEKIHKILQEEIGDVVLYENRNCERVLLKGLDNSEKRLLISIHSLLQKQAEEIEGIITANTPKPNGINSHQSYNDGKRDFSQNVCLAIKQVMI